jgi:hypothetical protein
MKYINVNDIALGAAMPYQKNMEIWKFLSTINDNGAIVAGLTNGNTPAYLALYGCTSTVVGSTYTIAAGSIVAGGIVVFTAATTITLAPGQVIKGTITQTYPQVGTYDPITFSDGTTHNVHAESTIVWTGATSGGDFNYSDLVFLQNPTRQVGTIATAQWDNGSGSTNFKYYKVPFNKLVIDTTLEKLSAGTATIITLPSGYRPSQTRYFTSFGGSVNKSTILTFQIDTAGNITLWNINGTLGLGVADVYVICAEIPLY